MKIITLGKLDKKFLIPILGGIFRMIFKFLLSLNKKSKIAAKNPFILSIYMSLGMILAFIPYLIIKRRTNKINKEFINLNENPHAQFSMIYALDNKLEIMKIRKYKLIFISVVLDFSVTVLALVFGLNCPYNFWAFEIIFISIFSYFILKTKLYKHQYITMFLIVFLGLILNIITYFKLDEDQKNIKIQDLLLKLLSEICLSLNYVIAKFNMESNYCSAYEVCIWEGLMGLILYIICLVIINSIGATVDGVKYPDNLNELVNNLDINDFIYFFMYIILNFIYNIAMLLTCNYFTPSHILILSIIHECYLYFKMREEDLLFNILGLIIIFLIFIIFLFFIEILELNIYDISRNTKKNIEIRAEFDSDIEENISIVDDSSEIELGIS